MPDNEEPPIPDMRERLASIPLLWREHDVLREEIRNLLRWQVLAQDQFYVQMRYAQERFDRQIAQLAEKLDRVSTKLDEAGDKLDGLIGAVEQMRQNFDARLRRLED